ncbi:MAG: EscU/YscU/HrcU family type III secretion system export apparatus switch protein [Treponema sp.]|nr:EscU/YscU/HrcU family type III secretion system export apparatus switch protein [Treponema sp.]
MSEKFFMDLQWFAAEDEGRTFDPTETTYRKAREEGRVAKSQELIAALGLLLPALALVFLAPGMLNTCAEMIRFFFTRINELDPATDKIAPGVFFQYYARLILPLFAVAVTAALFSNLVQTRGFLFTTKPLTPDFNKVVPHFGRYFQKTLFSLEGLVNFGKSIAKMAIIGFVAFFIIRSNINQLMNLQKAGLWNGITLISTMAAQMLIISALLMLLISIPDYLFQRWQFKESLKMTQQQFKEEMKQEEGDPQVRARLKARYRELLSRNLAQVVPRANVVITNPTHYSVAILYEMGAMEGPVVIAKGEDELATRIREIALANEVPVVRHPPLTRAIYARVEVGDVIPRIFWRVMIALIGKFLDIDRNARGEHVSQGLKMEA